MKKLLFISDGFNATENPELETMFAGATYLDGSKVNESNIEEGNIVVSENLVKFSDLLNPEFSEEIRIQSVEKDIFFKEIEYEDEDPWTECKYSVSGIKEKLKTLGDCIFFIMDIVDID